MSEVLILPAATLVIAALCVVRYWWLMHLAHRTRSWRPVTGEIIRSELDVKVVRTKRGDRDLYRPLVEYAYRAAGRDYVGARVYYGMEGWSGTADAADEILGRYLRGRQCTVFVNPVKHDEAVLEQGQEAGARRHLTYALVAIAAGVAYWIFFSKINPPG